jgi:hypothetical protein
VQHLPLAALPLEHSSGDGSSRGEGSGFSSFACAAASESSRAPGSLVQCKHCRPHSVSHHKPLPPLPAPALLYRYQLASQQLCFAGRPSAIKPGAGAAATAAPGGAGEGALEGLLVSVLQAVQLVDEAATLKDPATVLQQLAGKQGAWCLHAYPHGHHYDVPLDCSPRHGWTVATTPVLFGGHACVLHGHPPNPPYPNTYPALHFVCH